MSGKAFKDCTTADLFRFDPERVRIDTLGALADGRTALPILESLVLDVMIRGVIEPIVVRKDDDGEPVVIDGRQRLKAAQEANRRLAAQGAMLLKIPAVYRNTDDVGAYAAMISANEHRQDDDAIGRARKVQRFIDIGGAESDAAVACGVTTQTIRSWLKMLNAGPEVVAAMKAGDLGATAASEIASLPKKEQPEALERAKKSTPNGKPTVQQAKAAVKGDKPEKRKRMRGRVEVEFAMSHHPAELDTMTGTTALSWVLGHIEIEELSN
jgi:ParB family chromosome partitioning protein